MRKNAGIRLSSQKMNQWKKFSAVNVPNSPACRKSTSAKVELGTRSSIFHEASMAIGTTMADSNTISRPRPSTPR